MGWNVVSKPMYDHIDMKHHHHHALYVADIIETIIGTLLMICGGREIACAILTILEIVTEDSSF